jgi:hypothetical protein
MKKEKAFTKIFEEIDLIQKSLKRIETALICVHRWHPSLSPSEAYFVSTIRIALRSLRSFSSREFKYFKDEKKLSLIIYVSLLFIATACTAGGGGAGSTSKLVPIDPQATPTATPQPDPTATPQPTPTPPQAVTLTYYTKTVSGHEVIGGVSHPFTVVGYCADYNSITYCWDTGVIIPTGLTLNDGISFWGIGYLGGALSRCSGGTCVDAVTQPADASQSVFAGIMSFATPAQVLSTGIASQVSCTVSGTIVDCGLFQIDTAQAAL